MRSFDVGDAITVGVRCDINNTIVSSEQFGYNDSDSMIVSYLVRQQIELVIVDETSETYTCETIRPTERYGLVQIVVDKDVVIPTEDQLLCMLDKLDTEVT